MRILLVNEFYPPDIAPTGQHLHDLARCLADRGHAVEVLCSSQSYGGGGEYAAEEVRDGVHVRRVSMFAYGRTDTRRLADHVSFLVAAFGVAVRSSAQFGVTVCLTTPPYVGWVLPRALGRRRGIAAHWVMDLYPDVLAAHGRFAARGFAYQVLRLLTTSQLRGSALVLTLGERMQERVRAYAGGRTRLESVPLWSGFLDTLAAGQASGASCRERRGWVPEDLVLLYSGNMGLGHKLEEFLDGAARLVDGSGRRTYMGRQGGEAARRNVIWAFVGGGRRRSEVERFAATHPEAQVQLLPYVGQEDLAASLTAADVHLVSLRSPWQGLIVPSKLQAAFGVGRPVIFVGPRDCEPADWIEASGGGWIVSEGDVEGLLRVVDEARDPAERRRRGEAGRAYARVHFDRTTNTNRIADLLEEVAESARRTR